MKTWLVCYVINYSAEKRAYGNYIYHNHSLNTEDLLVKISKFCVNNYNTDRAAIINIIPMDG